MGRGMLYYIWVRFIRNLIDVYSGDGYRVGSCTVLGVECFKDKIVLARVFFMIWLLGREDLEVDVFFIGGDFYSFFVVFGWVKCCVAI